MKETYLIFEFSGPQEAEQGRRRISGWAKAFKLVYEQLAAVVEPGNGAARVIVRLAFGVGEELSYDRWLRRIPSEEPFDNVQCRLVESGSPEFTPVRESFLRLSRQ